MFLHGHNAPVLNELSDGVIGDIIDQVDELLDLSVGLDHLAFGIGILLRDVPQLHDGAARVFNARAEFGNVLWFCVRDFDVELN